jgi:hypothetical protein
MRSMALATTSRLRTKERSHIGRKTMTKPPPAKRMRCGASAAARRLLALTPERNVL